MLARMNKAGFKALLALAPRGAPMRRLLDVCLVVFISLVGALTPAAARAAGPALLSTLSAAQANDLCPAQARRINRIRMRQTTSALTLVYVDTTALKADRTSITLPSLTTLEFAKTAVEVRTSSDYTWHGAVAGTTSAATVAVHGANTTGSIRQDGSGQRCGDRLPRPARRAHRRRANFNRRTGGLYPRGSRGGYGHPGPDRTGCGGSILAARNPL